MKKLSAYVLLFTLALGLSTCKKNDEKIKELIIGEFRSMGVNSNLIYSNHPQFISEELHFWEDGTLFESPTGDCKSRLQCVTEYYIENNTLFIKYKIDNNLVWYKLSIKKINKRMLILIDPNDSHTKGWRYSRIN